MKSFWMSEACDLGPDHSSGAMITRLTSAVMSNINIYCEQPYTNPAGTRIAIMRSHYADPRIPPYELCVIDLNTLKLITIEKKCLSNFIATAGWSGILYYLDESLRLIKFSMDSLEKQIILDNWHMPDHFVLHSASPDGKYLIGTLYDENFISSIIRVDLLNGTCNKIFEHYELLTHLQFNPVNGKDILVQINRGMQLNHLHEVRTVPDKKATGTGATHAIIDVNGNNYRPLPIGEPITASSSGHSAWIADTARIGVTTHFNDMAHAGDLDNRYPTGNFFVIAPEETKPQVFHAPCHRFNHVSISKCGKYFVSDSYCYGLPGSIPLVIGNIKTGKCRIAISNCGAQGGGPACSHPHPYLTADNKHIIYNADPTLICHVYKAHIPDEFYESLE